MLKNMWIKVEYVEKYVEIIEKYLDKSRICAAACIGEFFGRSSAASFAATAVLLHGTQSHQPSSSSKKTRVPSAE